MADAKLSVPSQFFENVCLLKCALRQRAYLRVDKPRQLPLYDESSTMRTLSFENEESLCADFAYLSAITDDPSQVKAVCIEEVRRPGGEPGMKIWLAANSGDLEPLQKKLQNAVNVLSVLRTLRLQHAVVERVTAEEEALAHVVDLTRPRILQRLRSRYAPRTKKAKARAPPTQRLVAFIRFARKRRYLSISSKLSMNSILGYCQDLHSSFEELDALPEEQVLASEGLLIIRSLVVGFSRLAAEPMLAELTEKVGDCHEFQRVEKDYFLRVVKKLGRYYDVWKHLIRLAPRLPLFDNVQVGIVPGFGVSIRPSKENAGPTHTPLSDSCERVFGENWKAVKCRYSPFQEGQGLRRTFNETYSRMEGECRVHAEIIHLLHCSSFLPPRIKPRVVTATKEPCLLCGIFLRMHGGMHAPNTHGNLYEQWSIPSIVSTAVPALEIERFVGTFEPMTLSLVDIIRDVCLVYHGLPAGVDESSVSFIPSLAPTGSSVFGRTETSVSKVPSAFNETATMDEEDSSSADDRSSFREDDSPSSSEDDSPSSTSTVLAESRASHNSQGDSLHSHHPTFEDVFPEAKSLFPSPRLVVPSTEVHRLAPDEMIWAELGVGLESLRLRSGNVRLEIAQDWGDESEGNGGFDSSMRTPRHFDRCWIRASRQPSYEELSARSDGRRVNVEIIPVGQAFSLAHGAAISDTELILQHRGSVIRLKYAILSMTEDEA